MKYSNYTIGNRTRDLPTCSAVSQPTGPPRAPFPVRYELNIYITVKQSLNRPGVAQRVPGGLGSQIFMTFGK